MHFCSNLLLQILHSEFLPLMDCCNIFVYIISCFKFLITHVAFKSCSSFMNRWNMFFKLPLRLNLSSHMLHSKGFFPLWTWNFNCKFWLKLASHSVHSNGFFLSWTTLMYQFQQNLKLSFALPTLHAKYLLVSWFGVMWMFKELFCC